ncbi:MBL fold metallo-hydrolase, partial [Aliarcobacter skirrowii]
MNYLKVLGSSGNKSKIRGTTSFQISKDILVDAGNIINSLDEESYKINHIFLTHAHLDHIIDLPFILDNSFSKRDRPLFVYGSKKTLEFLTNHIFNNHIWPDFTKIKMLNQNENILIFKQIDEGEDI